MAIGSGGVKRPGEAPHEVRPPARSRVPHEGPHEGPYEGTYQVTGEGWSENIVCSKQSHNIAMIGHSKNKYKHTGGNHNRGALK
jgi:hypothetical protein